MKTQSYGITVDGQLILQKMYFDENTANQAAYQEHYDRFFKDHVCLVKCTIEYETIRDLKQKPKLKKRKKKRKRLKIMKQFRGI